MVCASKPALEGSCCYSGSLNQAVDGKKAQTVVSSTTLFYGAGTKDPKMDMPRCPGVKSGPWSKNSQGDCGPCLLMMAAMSAQFILQRWAECRHSMVSLLAWLPRSRYTVYILKAYYVPKSGWEHIECWGDSEQKTYHPPAVMQSRQRGRPYLTPCARNIDIFSSLQSLQARIQMSILGLVKWVTCQKINS